MPSRSAVPGLMIPAIAFAILALGWLPALAAAEAPPAGLLPLRAGAEGSTPEVTVYASDDQSVRFAFELPAVEVEHFEVEGLDYQTIHFARGELMGETGRPALPAFTRFVAIPAEVGATLRVIATEEQRLTGLRLLPMQDLDGELFALDAAAYARDEESGGEIVSLGEPAIWRDLRVVPVTIRPVRYNPARGEARVLTRIELAVDFSGLDPRSARAPRAVPLTEGFTRTQSASVINHDLYRQGEGRGEEAGNLGTWVLICRDNADVISRVQPLIEWRRRMGFNVYFATTAETGTTNTSIRNWLINAYNIWAQPPDYIALVGDAGGAYGIPTFNETVSGYGGEGDHPYSMLAGTDNVPEAFVGRLSFNSLTELDTIIAKILYYEKTPTLSQTTWYKAACLVGDPSGSGYTCIQIQQWVKERLRSDHAFTRIDTIFTSPFASRMTSSVNNGVSFFGYRGYLGMSGWDYSSIYALTNTNKLPFALNLTCGTGSFKDETSINEAWIRAGSPTNLTGGIGSIATATWGTHTRFNNCFYHGVAYGFYWEDLFRLGEAQASGKLEMILNYGQWEASEVTAWCYWNTLMGDPATELRTAYPMSLTVSYPSTVPQGSNVVTVEVGGPPTQQIEGAWVHLYLEDKIEIGGFTDSNGRVDLPIDGASPGTVLVTVTGHDLFPHQGSFTIQQAANFVGLSSTYIDDDGLLPSDGNGDGLVNPGERIVPRLQLANFGSTSAHQVTLTMSCDDPYIGLVNAGPIDYGDIPAGQIAQPTGTLVFDVAAGTPNGRPIRLELTVSSDEGSWLSLLDLEVAAPQIGFASYALTGCGAQLDPGESCTMTVTVRNDGPASALGPIRAQLISDSYPVDVVDDDGLYPMTILSGNSATNTTDSFSISSPADAIPGLLSHLRMALTFADGVRDTVSIALPVGTGDANDPTGPDVHGYLAYDNNDAAYPERPIYSWIDLAAVGQLVGLTDYGTGQDDTITLDLPFAFQYYGQTFTRVSICSNGWIAMGSTYLTDYRNWYMPAAGGPANQIAPFWDDIYQTTSGKVFHWFDAVNHRYVVAWDNVRMEGEYGNYAESFELILYDPAHYPTYTGDGVIVFQYEVVNDSDTVQHYATVGIQDRDHSTGLTYSYFHTLPATAAALQAGRAIKFTTAGPGASSAHSEALAGSQLRLALDAWPNPAGPASTIRFDLDRAQPVTLRLFDVDGRLVRTLVAGDLTAGRHTLEWRGEDPLGNPLPAGVYFYRLDAAGQSATRKLLLLR